MDINGVHVRSEESLATNFLSTLFYNGRRTVDLLDTVDDAQSWLTTMSTNIGPIPMLDLSSEDLESLREARDLIREVYLSKSSGLDSLQSFTTLTDHYQGLVEQPKVEEGLLNWSTSSPASLENLLAQLYISTVTTVTDSPGRRLHKCQAPNCVLFFTATSHRQKWCSNTCGNRARVAKHAS